MERRAGILVRLHDFGTGRHYLVDGVTVHDVNGADFKEPDPSGGILCAVQGAAKPTRFDGLTVRHSGVRHTDRTGIGTSSNRGRRCPARSGAGAARTGGAQPRRQRRGDGVGPQHRAVQRQRGRRNTAAPYGVISVVCGPATRTLAHNNALTTRTPGTARVSSNGPGGVTFRNNAFAGAPAGSPIADAHNTYDHNLYARVPGIPAGDTGAVRADPRFVAPTTCSCAPVPRSWAPAYGSRPGARRTSTAPRGPTRRTSAPPKGRGSRPILVVPCPQLGNFLRA